MATESSAANIEEEKYRDRREEIDGLEKHSERALDLMGERIPASTITNAGTGIRALARFVVGQSLEEESQFIPGLSEELKDKKQRARHEVEKLKQFLFHGCIQEETVPEDALERIRHHLIEFVVGFRKQNGEEATPVSTR